MEGYESGVPGNGYPENRHRATLVKRKRVDEGIRTLDFWNHNPVL